MINYSTPPNFFSLTTLFASIGCVRWSDLSNPENMIDEKIKGYKCATDVWSKLNKLKSSVRMNPISYICLGSNGLKYLMRFFRIFYEANAIGPHKLVNLMSDSVISIFQIRYFESLIMRLEV